MKNYYTHHMAPHHGPRGGFGRGPGHGPPPMRPHFGFGRRRAFGPPPPPPPPGRRYRGGCMSGCTIPVIMAVLIAAAGVALIISII